MAAKWEYRVSWMNIPWNSTDADKLNSHMAQWTSNGWELLNASSAIFELTTTQPRFYVRNSFYWRRPVS
jgi:hypothetical protein